MSLPIDPVYCPNCKKTVVENAKKCASCGRDLTIVAPPVTVPRPEKYTNAQVFGVIGMVGIALLTLYFFANHPFGCTLALIFLILPLTIVFAKQFRRMPIVLACIVCALLGSCNGILNSVAGDTTQPQATTTPLRESPVVNTSAEALNQEQAENARRFEQNAQERLRKVDAENAKAQRDAEAVQRQQELLNQIRGATASSGNSGEGYSTSGVNQYSQDTSQNPQLGLPENSPQYYSGSRSERRPEDGVARTENVSGYTRRDGTYVNSYNRRPARH